MDLEPAEAVEKHGLKALYPNHLLLGVISGTDLKADDYDRLHAMVVQDVMRLLRRIKEDRQPVCGVLHLDGNPVNEMIRSLFTTNALPIAYLTTLAPEKASPKKNIWYVPKWQKALAESCDVLVNYGNEELTDYLREEEQPEGLEVVDRELRPTGKTHQVLTKEVDPNGKFWVEVKNRMRVQRMAYRGIRINQIIDLRPPKLP